MNRINFKLLGLGVFASVATAFFISTQDVSLPSIAELTAQKAPEKSLRELEYEMKRNRRMNGYAKADKPDEFMNYHHIIRTGVDEQSPGYKYGYQLREYRDAMTRAAAARTEAGEDSIKWVERGPGNVPGRTRALIIDPADATRNTWIAGSASGGIWRSTNAGVSWTNLTPNLPNLSTNCLAMAMSNQNVIYAGTGEGYGNTGRVMGNGIFKSTNRGSSWQLLPSTANDPNFAFVNRIVVSPTNENILVAAVASGIMRSTDGGASWTRTLTTSGLCQQVIAAPNNPNTLYAAVNIGQVWKSVDGGINWTAASNGLNGSRVELAIVPQNANKIYASVEVSSTESYIFMSDDAAASWQKVDDGKATNYLAGQGWYDNCIAVSPSNENTVLVAGVNMWQVVVANDKIEGAPTLLSVDEVNTASFLSFVNVANFTLWGGRLQLLNESLATSVEIRFGANRKQKAHRFLVPEGATSGVPAANYAYQDYVDIPFEAWDITNNRQLMVSFRDQRRDGRFELEVRNDNDIPREYIYIHAIPYNATTPSSLITKNGGHEQDGIYSIWPLLTDGATWNPNILPNSTLRINYGRPILRNGVTTNITDGYGQFSMMNNNNAVHVDHHGIHFVPIGNTMRVISTNDGGFGLSEDGGRTFVKRGNGYNTFQCYGADKAKGSNQYVTGGQDNGCWVSPANATAASEYNSASGGDGFEVIWNAKSPNKVMTTSQYNNIYISTNGGANFRTATTGLTDRSATTAPFITRLGTSPNNPEVVFVAGSAGLWRTTDFGTNWQNISMPEGFQYRRTATESPIIGVLQARVSDADPQIVWAGGGMTGFSRLQVSTNGGTSFEQTSNFRRSGATTDFPMGAVTSIQPHPTEKNTAFAVFAIAGRPKILRTKDLGKTWTDITGFPDVNSKSTNGFPDVTVYCVFVFPRNPRKIWAGTEIGIFESTDEGASWAFYDKFPSAPVWQMKLVDNQVVVATHGRGVWTGEVPPSQVPLGLFEDLAAKPLNFYPNPSSSQITLQLPLDLQKYTLKVYNMLGQMVKTETIEASYQTTLKVSDLPKGVYVLHLQAKNQHYSGKLVVE